MELHLSATLKQSDVTSVDNLSPEAIAQLSRELVIGLVGYVGAVSCARFHGHLV